MFKSLLRAVDSLATIASRLDKISVALDDLVELQYREAGVVRTTTQLPPLPVDKQQTQVMYASDAASYDVEQAAQRDQAIEVSH